MMIMKKVEMPYRLRDFLPMFGDEPKAKHAEQVEGLAEFLGKRPRTIEAYLSYSEDRTISPDDYWSVAVEWIKRRSRSNMNPAFVVLDDNGDQLYECQWLWQAQFLADVEGASWVAQPSGHWQKGGSDDRAQSRSRLRRLLRSGLVTADQVCDVFNFDRWCLVDYQLEGVEWLSTPDELRLRVLEAFAAERLGEAA
ncbi:hypothetical protein LJR098_001053 [Rhizobium sp. LjRoot98]|uniref:hypothetical protein n=1 Tax=Rhizobium sp. LjRoot98 TaxID=3342345 RepID=UPI003ECCC85D